MSVDHDKLIAQFMGFEYVPSMSKFAMIYRCSGVYQVA